MTQRNRVEPTAISARVEVTRIRHYARNPRRQQNPEYDRIKSSIRAEGLDQPLVLTQEPGASDYILHSGGNTRLRILHELLAETDDDRFRWVACVIVPWTRESTALFAHLRENDLRGGLPFIDKALAVFEAKALLEQELSVASLSQRQLEDVFRERGFSLSHSMISKMGYTVETLWPVMPQALSAGLGRPQVEKLRALERAVKDVWSYHHLGDPTEVEEIFAELCRRYDGADWDIQPLRDALEHELAEAAELNRQVIHLAVEASLAGRPFEASHHPTVAAEDEADVEASDAALGLRAQKPAADSKAVKQGEALSPSEIAGKVPRAERAGRDRLPSARPGSAETVEHDDINTLRDQLWQHAGALAEHHGLRASVRPWPAQGLGFLVVEVPPSELTETLDAETLSMVSAVWWQLAACAELTIAPVDRLLPQLEESTVLHQALSSHDSGLLFSGVWTPDPAYLNSLLWQQLTPSDWQLWWQMIGAYRAIKRLAYDTGLSVWAADEFSCDVVE